MNFIKQLQADKNELTERIGATRIELAEFRSHLFSSKFVGTEADGSRKDWIAVKDVLTRLEAIKATLTTPAPVSACPHCGSREAFDGSTCHFCGRRIS